MKFVVCPSQCLTDADTDDVPTEVSNSKKLFSAKIDKKKNGSKGLERILQRIKTIAFGKSENEEGKKKTEVKSEPVKTLTETPRLIRSACLKDLTTANPASESLTTELKNYEASPKKVGSGSRKSFPVDNKHPPEKPKRVCGKKSETRRSPLLVVRKPGTRSPVIVRGSPLRSKKYRSRNNKKGCAHYRETSFLSAIAEEHSRKFITN